MGLSRTFVGFSSTDIHYYRLMLAWKENEHIDFNFANCQLGKEINSEDEAYIRRKCRERIDMAGTFAVLIGQDTRSNRPLKKSPADAGLGQYDLKRSANNPDEDDERQPRLPGGDVQLHQP